MALSMLPPAAAQEAAKTKTLTEVAAGASHDEIQDQAAREGMVRLTTQALSLARSGAISLQEVFRARLED